MKEFYTTLGLALGVSLPATVLCWFYTLTLIPTGAARNGIVGIILAPELWLVNQLKHHGMTDLSGFTFVPLALLAQFVGYAVVFFLLRLFFRLVRGERA